MLHFTAELLSIEVRTIHTFKSMASHPCQHDMLLVSSSLSDRLKMQFYFSLIVNKVKNLFIPLRTIYSFLVNCVFPSLARYFIECFALLKLICQCSLHFRKFTLWLRFQCVRFFPSQNLTGIYFTVGVLFYLAENCFNFEIS